jgi:hypothetical protein
MAGNRVRALARQLVLTITDGGVAAGDPCRVGELTGVALQAKVSSKATVDFDGAYNLSVAAINDSGGSAVVAGDALFYVDADTPKISKKVSGRFFGWALEAVTVSQTATIAVKLGRGANPGGANTYGGTTVGAGSISHADLQADAVQSDVVKNKNILTAALNDAAVTGPKFGTGIVNLELLAGTNAAADVTLAAMAATDEIAKVIALTNTASIATAADRTSEYVAGAGKMTKAAGTDERNNSLLVLWIKHT